MGAFFVNRQFCQIWKVRLHLNVSGTFKRIFFSIFGANAIKLCQILPLNHLGKRIPS